ncbi:MAG: hypothetical protein OHK0056_19530 [Bacteriovoracaceae bacterium]
MGKVGVPLKLKFTIVILALLLGSVGFYVYYAIDIFRKDKSADIYNNSLVSANQISKELNGFLLNNLKNLKRVSTNPNIGSIIKSYLAEESHLFAIEIYENKLGKWQRTQFEFEKNYTSLYDKSGNLPEIDISKNNLLKSAVHFSHNENIPGWILSYEMVPGSKILISRVKIDFLKQMLTSTAELFSAKIVDAKGISLVSLSSTNETNYKNELLEFSSQAVRQLVKKVGDSLVAFVKVDDFPLIVETFISEKKAFSAAAELQKKSIYFGTLIFSLVVIVAVLFARALTKNIQLLTQATEKVALGEFETQLNIKSNDEIGMLAKSFEFMGREILKYIEEMKEKSRLENEVKVAQLVQQTYFPKNYEKIKNIETSYQFKSASECGGDWWGYYSDDNYFNFLICDATGHGVPAALLTATASSALATMEKLADKNDLGPKRMLEIFNSIVAELEGQINLTAIAGRINMSTGELNYSNASHHPIWIIKNESEKSIKERIEPLLGTPGLRIGQHKETQYEEFSYQLKNGDEILLITDGILELENIEAKAYGQRRLIKALEASSELNPSEKLSFVMKDAMTFSDDKNNDDITLSLVKWTDQTQTRLESESNQIHLFCSKTLDPMKLMPTPEHNIVVHFEDIQHFLAKDKYLVVAPSDLQNLENKSRAIVFSNLSDEENIKILKSDDVFHLVGENSPYLFEEINLAMTSFDSDLIDLMKKGAEIKSIQLSAGDNNSDIIEKFLKNFDFSEYFESPANYLHFMALELVNNIIMHGEVSKTELSFIKSRNYVAIRVKDNVGKLDRNTIVDAIWRGYEEKTPKQDGRGAGLGLYLTYSQCNQLWINSLPNVSTEIVCLIESNKRYKKYKERITSFHFILRGHV